jgi:two-component system LytT family response regulator
MTQKSTIRTIIIEDDPISMKLLKEFLKRFDHIEVINEATNFQDAEEVLKNTESFELLITDIDLQGANALDLIKYVNPNINILFTTSFAEFAVKAFEYNTIDYILKPLSFDRLQKALARIKLIKDQSQAASAEAEQQEAQTPRLGFDNMILMNINNEMKFIKIKDINYIEAKGNYTTISLVDGTSFTTYGLIKVWEDKLPMDDFLRIHRSTIVNLHNVDKIEKGTYDTGILHLKGVKEPFEISRNYFSMIKNKFKLTSNLLH